MSAESELDIRWPIGLLFTFMGIVVAIYGLISSARTPYRPLDGGATALINLNLWWGLVMLVFGVVMIAGALRAGSQSAPGGK
jgi:hypothetical protein